MTRLTVSDLSIAFTSADGAQIAAVDHLALTITQGEILVLIGESGSGKSLTALSLLGLAPQEAHVTGRLDIDGQAMALDDVSSLAALRGSQIGLVFQDPMSSLNPVLRIGEQVTEVFRRHRHLAKADARAAAIALLASLGLPDAEKRIDNYPHQFSGGQRQRIAIAMAIAAAPRFLIADEPTTALDVTVQAQIMALLQRLVTGGMGLLFITHDIALAADHADRLAVIYAGRIVEQGACADLVNRPTHPYTALLLRLARAEHLDPDETDRSAPGPANWQHRCAFAARCDAASDRCRTETPELISQGEHRFACHHPLNRTDEANA